MEEAAEQEMEVERVGEQEQEQEQEVGVREDVVVLQLAVVFVLVEGGRGCAVARVLCHLGRLRRR